MKWVRDAKTYKVKLARGGARRLNNADEEWLFAKPLGHRHRIRARFGADVASDAYEIPGDGGTGGDDFLSEMASSEDKAAPARIFPLPVRRASVFPARRRARSTAPSRPR